MIQLLKNLHGRIGYPFGKLHQRLNVLSEKMKEPGSPLRHWRRIRHRIFNCRELRQRKELATLGLPRCPATKARVQQFVDTGFTDYTEAIDPTLMAELNAYYDEVISLRSAASQAFATHPFFFALTEPSEMTTDNIVIRFALQDSIVEFATAYFGCVPFLSGVTIMESRPDESPQPKASQQWHLDYSVGGDEQISFWVYLNDVTGPEHGPFTFIPIEGSKRVANDFFPRRIKDEEIEAAGLSSEVKRVTGLRSAAFVINTLKCYHMGSRVQPGEKRIACIISYVRPATEPEFVKITAPIAEEKRLIIRRN